MGDGTVGLGLEEHQEEGHKKECNIFSGYHRIS